MNTSETGTANLGGQGWGPVISVYSQEQAIEDGMLVHVGNVGAQRVVFTSGLFAEGYEDQVKRAALVNKGLELVRQPDPEDDDYRKLRVIAAGKIWVILDGDGFTFLRPDDY